MRRRKYLSLLGTGAAGAVAGCSAGSLTSGNESNPARRSVPLVSGVKALEWVSGGRLRVEATDDADWRGWVLEGPEGDDWIASGNRSLTAQSATIDVFSTGELLPRTYTLKLTTEEIEAFNFDTDWKHSLDVDMTPEIDVTVELEGSAQAKITAENTGSVPVEITQVKTSHEGRSGSGAVSSPVILPGDTKTVTTESTPLPRDGEGCHIRPTELDARVITKPIDDFETVWSLDVDSQETVCIREL